MPKLPSTKRHRLMLYRLRWASILTIFAIMLGIGWYVDQTQQRNRYQQYSAKLNAELAKTQLFVVNTLRPLDIANRPLLIPEDISRLLSPVVNFADIRVAYQDGTYRQLNRGNPHQQYRVTFDDADAVSATLLLTQNRIWQTYFLAGREQDIRIWPTEADNHHFTLSLFLPSSRQLILLDMAWPSLLPVDANCCIALQYENQTPVDLLGNETQQVTVRRTSLVADWQLREVRPTPFWIILLPLIGLTIGGLILFRLIHLHSLSFDRQDDGQNRLFTHLSDTFNLLMLITDREGTVTWQRGLLSPELDALQLQPGDSLRHAWSDVPKALSYFQQTVRGETLSFEIEMNYFLLQVHQWPNHSANGEVTGLTLTIQDITEKRLLEEQFRHEQHHDALTGLPNRQLFQEQLYHDLHRSRRREENLAVIALEVSGIGQINSLHGDTFSDQLLRQIGRNIAKMMRDEDSLCRYSNDEFLMGVSDFHSPEDLHELAERLIRIASATYQIDGHNVALFANVGIATFPTDARDVGSLITCAITAMRHARQTGRNTLDYFSEESARRAQEKWQLERQMTEALSTHDFQLFYQPIFDLESNRCIAAEALLRWPSTKLMPDHFIPIAEECGLIYPMGRWILETAIRQWVQWHDEGRELSYLSVNISVLQLQQPGFVDEAISLAKQLQLPPASIVLEITETVLLQTSPDILQRLNALQSAGYRLAIDDFGTGFSSLNYLKQLPINFLKVDRTFVEGIIENNQDSAIYRAIVDLAIAMHIEIVAEGVETPQQMLWLKQQGVTFAQGYFYTQALPAEQFVLYLSNQSNTR